MIVIEVTTRRAPMREVTMIIVLVLESFLEYSTGASGMAAGVLGDKGLGDDEMVSPGNSSSSFGPTAGVVEKTSASFSWVHWLL